MKKSDRPPSPAEKTSFVGRQLELGELDAALRRRDRLVTVVGPAGIGKTRLARRYALEHSAKPAPAPCWFCELAEVHSLDGILSVIGATLDLVLTHGPTLSALVDQIGHFLNTQGEAVLILDNFEHVVAYAAPTLGRWLDLSPSVSFVVTSRERLGLSEETCLFLESLPDADAAQLFEERARAVRRDFALSDDSPLVMDIVQRLDGIPLAIELAAARVGVLGPRQLLERLADRFQLLRSSRRDASERQATLWNAIGWSWDLLSPVEKDVLAQASVFEGSFSLEAAEGVIEMSEPSGPPLIDVIQALRDKSMLHATGGEPAQEVRFRLLESMRAFCADKLRASSHLERVRTRHATYYMHAAERPLARLPLTAEDFDLLSAELPNILAAHRHAVGRSPETVARITVAIGYLLRARGPAPLELELVEIALDEMAQHADLKLRAFLFVNRANARRLLRGEVAQGEADLKMALGLARESGDSRLEAVMLMSLGRNSRAKGDHELAKEHFCQALPRAQAGPYRALEAMLLNSLADIELDAGRISEARTILESALSLTPDDPRVGAYLHLNLGCCHQDWGRLREAENHFGKARSLILAVGDRRNEGAHDGFVGILHHEAGRLDEARASYDQAILLLQHIDQFGTAKWLHARGTLSHLYGDLETARQDLLEARARLMTLGNRREIGITEAYLGALDAEQGDREAARGHFTFARELLKGKHSWDAVFDVLEGLMELSLADEAAQKGDQAASRRHREQLVNRVALARRTHSNTAGVELRLALNLVERRANTAGTGGRLLVGPEAKWFELPDGRKVALSRHKLLSRLLLALVEQRISRPGEGLSLEAMLRAGWPGEKIRPDAGAARVYGAIRLLRKAGLRDFLLTSGDGYLIDSTVPVEWAGR